MTSTKSLFCAAMKQGKTASPRPAFTAEICVNRLVEANTDTLSGTCSFTPKAVLTALARDKP